MTISLDNVAEVFKSERTSLVETIILQNFIKFKTKALSKVLRRIRDDKKIKCERLAFNNCHFQKVCPKLFCSTLNKMSYVFIGDDFRTKTTETQITFLLWTIILHPVCKIMKLEYGMMMKLFGPRKLLAAVENKLQFDHLFGKVKEEDEEEITFATIKSILETGLRADIIFEGREEEYEEVKNDLCRTTGQPRNLFNVPTGHKYIKQLDGKLRRIY